jgi:hypothetical protein
MSQVANTCCNGRIVSVLEGGYKIHGGIVSPFARSVASHVRALVDGGNSRELYDTQEGEWESQFERHLVEEKEKKRQMKVDRLNRQAVSVFNGFQRECTVYPTSYCVGSSLCFRRRCVKYRRLSGISSLRRGRKKFQRKKEMSLSRRQIHSIVEVK